MKLRRLLAVVVTAIVITIASHAEPASASPGEFVGSINGLRASKGLGSLSTDGALSAQAQRWAQQMASANKISHNPNLGGTPGNWTKVGENVGTGGSVGAIFSALVASPGHYRNMVDGSFNKIGVGEARGSDGRIYTCHVFAKMPGGGGGGAAKSSAPAAKRSAAAPARKASAPAARPASGGGAPAKAAAPAAKSGSSASGNGGTSVAGVNSGDAAASGDSADAPAAPAGPAPSSRIVAGLVEVGSIPTQG